MKKFLLCFLFLFFLNKSVFAQSPVTNDVPILALISPTNNEQIFGSKVTVSFIVKNFVFTDFTVRTKNQTGEGHLNIWLDENNSSYENAQKIIRATDFTLEDIKAGNHQLILELVNNDNTSLKPPVVEVISFTTIAQREIPTVTVTGEIKKDEESEKIKRVQRLTRLLSLFSIGLVAVSLTVALGLIIFNRVLNK